MLALQHEAYWTVHRVVRPECLSGQMQINLSRGDAGVAEESLQMRQAAAAADIVGGESVPEDVRPQFRTIQSCTLENPSDSHLHS